MVIQRWYVVPWSLTMNSGCTNVHGTGVGAEAYTTNKTILILHLPHVIFVQINFNPTKQYPNI